MPKRSRHISQPAFPVSALTSIAFQELSCCIGANIYLHPYACSFLHNVEQVPCRFGIQVCFSADLAHLSRYILKDHCRVTPLKRHSGGPRLGFSLLANDTFHVFFLLKYGPPIDLGLVHTLSLLSSFALLYRLQPQHGAVAYYTNLGLIRLDKEYH